MYIELSPKLKDYLCTKNIKEITIDYIQLKMCWVTPCLPSVLTGKPSLNKSYILHEYENLYFYIDENLYTSIESLKLDLRKFILLNEIYVVNHKL